MYSLRPTGGTDIFRSMLLSTYCEIDKLLVAICDFTFCFTLNIYVRNCEV